MKEKRVIRRIVERVGSGIPTLFSTWKEQEWEIPIIEEIFNLKMLHRTTLILPFKKSKVQSGKVPKSNGETLEKKILECISNQKDIKQEDIADEIGISIQSVKRYMKIMNKKGSVARAIGKRYGHWKVHEK